MGVFTSLTAEEIKTHLKGYDLGELDYFEAITEGIENSNYLIATHRHDHQFLSILTLVEGDNTAKVGRVVAEAFRKMSPTVMSACCKVISSNDEAIVAVRR